MDAFALARIGNWVLSVICGGMGLFTLWFTFRDSSFAPFAIVFLGLALALESANQSAGRS